MRGEIMHSFAVAAVLTSHGGPGKKISGGNDELTTTNDECQKRTGTRSIRHQDSVIPSSFVLRHFPSFRRPDLDLLVRLLHVDDHGLVRQSFHQLVFDLFVRL